MQAKINKLIPKDRDHWLEMRKPVITSTEIAALLGVSEWGTPYSLYQYKLGGVEQDYKENERTKWGQLLEAVVAQAAAEKLDITPVKDDYFYWSDDMRLGASLDYRCDDGRTILECKNCDSLIFKQKFLSEGDVLLEAPLYIEMQLQQQLLLTGAEKAILVVLVGGNKLMTLERFPDKQVQEKIIMETRKFWAMKEPPPVHSEADLEVLNQMYNNTEHGEEIEADENLDELLASYSKLAEIANNADRGKKAIKAVILDTVKNAKKVFGSEYRLTRSWVKGAPVSYNREGYSTFKVTKVRT